MLVPGPMLELVPVRVLVRAAGVGAGVGRKRAQAWGRVVDWWRAGWGREGARALWHAGFGFGRNWGPVWPAEKAVMQIVEGMATVSQTSLFLTNWKKFEHQLRIIDDRIYMYVYYP